MWEAEYKATYYTATFAIWKGEKNIVSYSIYDIVAYKTTYYTDTFANWKKKYKV